VFAHSPEVTLGAFAAVLLQEAIAYDYVRMWLGEAPRWDWPDYSRYNWS